MPSKQPGPLARTSLGAVRVLSTAEWRPLAEAHAARVDDFVEPHLARRADQVKHPVHDFLFTYYSQRPAQLRRWHPGFGVALEDAEEYAGLKGYAGDPVAVTAAYVASQRPLLESAAHAARRDGRPPAAARLLRAARVGDGATARRSTRPGTTGRCGSAPAGTDAVVESHRIACSHFDAFRFFTPTARPLNTLQPGRDDRPAFEQPGCLHAGMDLYKHAFRLTPMVSSDLVADCFELAWDIRVLDMRAAPYDLADLGFEPVRIETTEGKAAYVEAQRGFAERGAPLRARLVAECERLLDADAVAEVGVGVVGIGVDGRVVGVEAGPLRDVTVLVVHADAGQRRLVRTHLHGHSRRRREGLAGHLHRLAGPTARRGRTAPSPARSGSAATASRRGRRTSA